MFPDIFSSSYLKLHDKQKVTLARAHSSKNDHLNESNGSLRERHSLHAS